VQNRYAHEIAVVRFKDWNVQYNEIRPTSPVQCTIRGKDFSREFVGYIHDIKPSMSPGTKTIAITLIGASYSLKQAKQRVFENMTADKIVSQIAAEHGFAVFAEPHPRVYEQVAQTGQTDLQLMSRLARQCGYSLRLENTTIYFQSLTTDYVKNRQSAPVFEMRDANDPEGSTLYSFNLTVGESVNYVDAYKSASQVGGVDPVTISPVITTNQIRPDTMRDKSQPEIFDNYATEIVAPSYEAAYYEAYALDQKNKFPYRATAKVIGNPNVRPDQPVYLSGIGADYTGYWIVLSSRHDIVETQPNVFTYTTVLEVGADSLGQASVMESLLVTAPSATTTRSLTAGVRDVPLSGSAIINTSGTVSPTNNGFAPATLRPQPTTNAPITKHKWVAKNASAMNSKTDVKNRSAAVIQKLEAKGVL
jgi:phage protein D